MTLIKRQANKQDDQSNKVHLSLKFGMAFILLFFMSPLIAGKHHSHQNIQETAVELVRSLIPDGITIKEITAGKIDSRIHFKQCSQALEASSSMGKHIAKNWTIAIHCAGKVPWRIYIPVKAELTQKMITSNTTITRGELITADKLTLIEREISNRNKKYFSELTDIIGREARRTIRPNHVISSSMLQEALMVHKKESVLIYAKNARLKISMKGTALKNGRYNEMIRVRNNSSNKIIDAVVIDRGVVAVNF